MGVSFRLSFRVRQEDIKSSLPEQSPNSLRTTEKYLKSLGLEHVREALEEGLKETGKVIPFEKEKTLRGASSEG